MKVKLFFNSRYIEPNFTSFGVGFLRSDNFRYEIKAEKEITSTVKLTLGVRHDEDNLLKLFDYTNILTTLTSQLQFKLFKRWSFKVLYNPVIQQTYNKGDIFSKNNSSIWNTIATYSPKTKKIQTSISGLYSYYNIVSQTGIYQYQSVSYLQQIQFNSPLSCNMNVSWFNSSKVDTSNNKIVFVSLDNNYTYKKIMMTGTIKASFVSNSNAQVGYRLKVQMPLIKKISFSLSVEKLILGDFYNSVLIANVKKFPFFGTAALICNW